ncbi:MAG: leucine-rich repeat domain-containing protein, partial [Clostridia bacterium]|nr:leucine-rich repeat domain-containing protein [Clostridia bacterium]
MAKNYSNKESRASLIFTWILIILIAIGSFMIFKNYKDNYSDIIKNDELAQALSTAFDKPVGKITTDDLASVNAIAFNLFEESLLNNSQSIAINSSEKKNYITEATFLLNDTNYSALIPYDEFLNYLNYFSGIKSFTLERQTSLTYILGMEDPDSTVFDMNKLPSETFKNLENIYVSNVAVNNANSLGNHKNLKTLQLNNTGINDISSFNSLTSLEALAFNGDDFSDISALESLTNLKTLVIAGNNITDVSTVKNLTNLEGLALSGNKITDVTAIENLSALKELSVTDTTITALPSFEKLTALEVIDLSNNGLTDISALSVLNNDKVKNVYLTGNAIEDFSPIAHIAEDKITKDEPEEENEEVEEEK